MENHGVIIFHLRVHAGLTVRETARKINKSIGWLSEIENGSGTARITDLEFDRIVGILGGSKDKAMFKTWVAGHKNKSVSDRTFDGAVLKYIRINTASRLMRLESPPETAVIKAALAVIASSTLRRVSTAY